MSTMLPCSVIVGREIHFQTDGRRIDKTHGNHRSTKDRDFDLGGGLRERSRDRQMPGDDHTRDVLLAELHTPSLLFIARQTF